MLPNNFPLNINIKLKLPCPHITWRFQHCEHHIHVLEIGKCVNLTKGRQNFQESFCFYTLDQCVLMRTFQSVTGVWMQSKCTAKASLNSTLDRKNHRVVKKKAQKQTEQQHQEHKSRLNGGKCFIFTVPSTEPSPGLNGSSRAAMLFKTGSSVKPPAEEAASGIELDLPELPLNTQALFVGDAVVCKSRSFCVGDWNSCNHCFDWFCSLWLYWFLLFPPAAPVLQAHTESYRRPSSVPRPRSHQPGVGSLNKYSLGHIKLQFEFIHLLKCHFKNSCLNWISIPLRKIHLGTWTDTGSLVSLVFLFWWLLWPNIWSRDANYLITVLAQKHFRNK